MASELDATLEYAAAKLGVEWATKVRETFRQLGTSIPPAWPGTRAGARSLVDWLRHTGTSAPPSQEDLDRLTEIVDLRATQAWRQIRCWSGEATPDETSGGAGGDRESGVTPVAGRSDTDRDRTGRKSDVDPTGSG